MRAADDVPRARPRHASTQGAARALEELTASSEFAKREMERVAHGRTGGRHHSGARAHRHGLRQDQALISAQLEKLALPATGAMDGHRVRARSTPRWAKSSEPRAYRIRIALPDDTPLMAGMSVEANVITREKAGALLVPADAVQGGQVFVVDGDRVRRRQVMLGIRGTRATEIVSGLKDGELVASPAMAAWADGQRVRLGAPENEHAQAHFSSLSRTCASACVKHWWLLPVWRRG